MLVLTRKPQQSILIGELIRVKILNIQHHQAVIGISAPRWMTIMREEILEKYPDLRPSFEFEEVGMVGANVTKGSKQGSLALQTIRD